MIKKHILSLRTLLPITGVYWITTMIANVLNLLYNVQLGRVLSKEDFGVLTVFLSFQYLIAVPAFAISSTIARFIAFYTEKHEEEKHFYFFRQYWWLSVGAGTTLFLLFLLIKPFIQSYFAIPSGALLTIFSATFFPLFLLSFEKGNMLGKLALGWISVLVIIEPLVKLGLVTFGSDLSLPPLSLAVLALPVSMGITWFISLVITRSFHPMSVKTAVGRQKDIKDTYTFLGNALFAGLGTVLLSNLDILLAKHYLSPSDAGIYSTLSLFGKILYFGAGSLIPLLIPITARAEAKNVSTRKAFSVLLTVVGTVGSGVLLLFYLFPQFIVSLLLKSHGDVALPYLIPYSFAMLFFVLAQCFSSYHLAKKNYLPARLMIVAAVIQGILITLFHNSIEQIVFVVLSTLSGLFLTMLIADSLKVTLSSVRENMLSFTELFAPFRVRKPTSTQKNVLILNWRDTKHVYAGGAEIYLHELAKELTKRKYQVTIFTSNDTKSSREEVSDGITIIRRGGFITVYVWAAIYLLTKFRNKFSFVIDSENGIPFFSPLFTRTPQILLMHHVHQDVFLKHLVPPFSWIANFLETVIMPIVYKKAPIISVSPSTAAALEEQLGLTTSAIISTGINTEYYKPGKKSKTPLVSYVGRLKAYKGVHHLITAFADVVKKIPTATLIIAGDGDYRHELEKEIKKHHLSKQVTLVGRISDDEKRTLLQQSWIMVHPSYMEGWGITCLEANACGTPVLAADSSGLRDAVVIDKSGYLFPHGDIAVLSQKMIGMLLEKKQLLRLNQSARSYSQQFSWSRQTKKLEVLFDSIKTKKPYKKSASKSLGTLLPKFTHIDSIQTGGRS